MTTEYPPRKKGRECPVCGEMKRMWPTDTICFDCRCLSPEMQKRKIRERKRPKPKRRSVRTISGGLPSLGKRR